MIALYKDGILGLENTKMIKMKKHKAENARIRQCQSEPYICKVQETLLNTKLLIFFHLEW